ncbi:DmsC/YnfH family molybdoenzyme membrane anchor subunit [Haloferula sargassicola]|uniref:DmsC/YnfH family molybdoenzyme membrane anchor subunit n=1 Tax=Haloferula sargassicola TaxID=490096 RepID=UPI0033658360
MVTTLQPSPPEKPPLPKASELRTLIDDLIAEQSTLQTPVARFAEIHDRQPDLADHYRNLIPLSKPGPGEQYAFEVSLDRCTGCKACVSACHNLNGLDDHEAWRDTGTLVGGNVAPGWQQTVTTACHHCEDPGCLNGCPVGAYEKDRSTGIVRHLDDQCIGCSYCILKCPYDVPKYSKKRGIVRKCDMCHQRLAEGEAPACVQACPTEAIRIVKVASSREPVAGVANADLLHFSLHAPTSALPAPHTLPTTRFLGRQVPATARAADRDQLVPQHAHWPLVFMLVLTQAGIGLLGSTGVPPVDPGSALPLASHLPTLLGALLFNLGMAAATLHLGQPLKAWRFFLGLRTSWLSREILAFSLFAPIPLLLAAAPYLPDFPLSASFLLSPFSLALPAGALAIFTSVMIYHDTRRSLWRLPLTATRFYGTTAAFLFLALSIDHPWAKPAFALTLFAKAIPELLLLLKSPPTTDWTPDLHSARLMLGPLKKITLLRFATALAAIASILISPWLALPLLLASEILERQLFFQAVQAPKMPGHFGGF